EFRAIEVHQLDALLHTTVERKTHLPGPRKDVRVLDRRLVHYVVRTRGRVAFDHMQRFAMVIPCSIEPAIRGESLGIYDQRIALKVPVRPPHQLSAGGS